MTTSPAPVSALNLTPEVLADTLREAGHPAYRAQQVLRWLYRGARSFDEMTDLPKALRAELKGINEILGSEAVQWSKVGEQVRHIISELLMRQEVHDDVLSAHSISVTEVRMSPDLRHAMVFVPKA